jgi:hypothetical protein
MRGEDTEENEQSEKVNQESSTGVDLSDVQNSEIQIGDIHQSAENTTNSSDEGVPASPSTNVHDYVGLVSTIVSVIPASIETIDRVAKVGGVGSASIGLVTFFSLVQQSFETTPTLIHELLAMIPMTNEVASPILTASIVVAAVCFGYIKVRRESTCNLCGEPFSVDDIEEEVIPPHDDSDKEHRTRRLKCGECGEVYTKHVSLNKSSGNRTT